MPYVNCLRCEKEMYAKPRHLKRGWGKFCSQLCQFAAQRTGSNYICRTCGKEVYRTPKESEHSRSGNFFCNKICHAVWKNGHSLAGENHVGWKHGEHAYRNIMKRAKIDPICRDCKISNFRVLLVHHKDRNRKNNKLENLVWLCHNCHFLEHYDDKRKKNMVPIA